MGITFEALIAGVKEEIRIVTVARRIIRRTTSGFITTGTPPVSPLTPMIIPLFIILLPRTYSVTLVPIYPRISPRGIPMIPRISPSK